jgi:hypothetical protein
MNQQRKILNQVKFILENGNDKIKTTLDLTLNALGRCCQIDDERIIESQIKRDTAGNEKFTVIRGGLS